MPGGGICVLKYYTGGNGGLIVETEGLTIRHRLSAEDLAELRHLILEAAASILLSDLETFKGTDSN